MNIAHTFLVNTHVDVLIQTSTKSHLLLLERLTWIQAFFFLLDEFLYSPTAYGVHTRGLEEKK